MIVEPFIPSAITLVDYDDAIRAMKAGGVVTRYYWLTKGIWVCLVNDVVAGQDHLTERLRVYASNPNNCPEHEGSTMTPTFAMRCENGKIHYGWLATHDDQLAEDWIVLQGNKQNPLKTTEPLVLIDNTTLSARAKNALRNQKVTTLHEVRNLSTRELLQFPNLGHATLKEILDYLEHH